MSKYLAAIMFIIVIILSVVVVYQGINIHKLNIKSDNIYNQFINNKETIMDSVRINNKALSLIQYKISKLKVQLSQQKPIYYQMNQQEIQQFMSYILGKYNDEY